MKEKKIAERVTEYILTRETEELAALKVATIASTFGVNPSYLSRVFKGEKEITLNEFITGEKMFRSVILLKKNKNISMDQLSKIMGFSRADYFISLFKSYFGVHPQKFKQIKKPEKG
ncbi:MAG: helix-turn-helix transcriptional regulator [bacterium]|nr:helix-turn-helix transcriptional regulator [bacterium]